MSPCHRAQAFPRVSVSPGVSSAWGAMGRSREAGGSAAASCVVCLLEMLALSLGLRLHPATVSVSGTHWLSKVVGPAALREVSQSPPLWQAGLRPPQSTHYPCVFIPESFWPLSAPRE